MSSDPAAAVAIVGMACTFPGARTVSQFWENILNKVDAVTEVTPDRWDPDIFYDPDPNVEDRVYCKKGGWIGGTFAFNPLKYGIMPSTIDGAEPDHFLVLRTVDEALADAGYADRPLDGTRVSVILGKGNYLGPGVTGLLYRGVVTEQTLAVIKELHPEISSTDLATIKTRLRASLSRMNAEVAPGLIPNICTGRVANRLDFQGKNFTIDAACASSLIATELGIRGLLSGEDDLVLVGGVHIFSHITFLQVFDAMRALSLSSTIKPFDEHADGTICGEGVGVLVLKRLADAERDGDRIYALVRAAASASDGRAKSVTAPRAEGEELALRRTYAAGGESPDSVELIEAHGTGTPVGDQAELEALGRVFGASTDGRPTCAIGSVKSMIGHAMPAAGAAGLIKAALSLYHGVLPPTLHCDEPRRSLTDAASRFYVNTQTRPWIHSVHSPRRAGVNAFGFGGINAHALLEEYRGPRLREESVARTWSSEVVLLSGDSRQALVASIDRLRNDLRKTPAVELRDVAYTYSASHKPSEHSLAIVATSPDDLSHKLGEVMDRLEDPSCHRIKDRNGVYYNGDGGHRGKVAVLFPGEGSQHVNMLSELCVHFPEVRRAFDLADSAVPEDRRWPASAVVYPPPPVSEDAAAAADARLWSIDRATEAVLAADAATFNLLERLGVVADMMAGHSAGEWIAMAAAGIVDRDEFVSSLVNLAAIHRQLDQDSTIPRMCMLAVGAGRDVVEALARDLHAEVVFANDNCAHQVVIVAAPADERTVVDELHRRGIYVEKLPFERGYHSPAFDCIREPLRQHFSAMNIRAPRVPLYSCTTAQLFPRGADEIIELLSATFARPLLFRQTIEAMYEDGARIFIEAGPRGNLSAFVDDILRNRPHLTVAIDQTHRTGVSALNHAIGMLASAGVPLDLDWLYRRRSAKRLAFDPAIDGVDVDRAPGTVQVPIRYPRLEAPLPAVQYSSLASEVASPVPPAHTARVDETAAAPNVIPSAAARVDVSGRLAVALTDQSILEQHCSLMEEFLVTQEAVMLGYLGASASAAPSRPRSFDAHTTVATLEVPKAVAPPSFESEAGERQTSGYPSPAEPAPSRSDDLGTLLLRIVSERTGYPTDMLGLDMDLEADLGIDSIKRVEILSALQQETGGADAAESHMEELGKLKTLRQILAFIGQADSPGASSAQSAPATAPGFGPLLKSARVVDQVPEQSVTIECVVSADDHLYLHDHCLYYPAPGQGGGLVSMPMTCALELMAESASVLCPGLKVVGVRNLQALRWINFERPAFRATLSISARRVDGRSVRVAIRSAAKDGDRGVPDIHAEATILFGERYPDPPGPLDSTLRTPRAPVCSGPDVYTTHMMFHGPSFQGLTSLTAVSEDGVLGTIRALPNDRVLASNRAPRFHIDPFLLDAAGQIAGYWPSEFLREGHVVLPIGLSELTLYAGEIAPGTIGECRARIRDLTNRRFRSDLDVLGPDGRLVMRIVGWEDWRFYWDEHIYKFWRFPDRNPNGVRIEIPGEAEIECRRVVLMNEMDNSNLWESLWMHMILTPAEVDECRGISRPEARREWMFRRAAVKDVVRMWMQRHAGRALCPSDVEVVDSGNGAVQVRGRWTTETSNVPHVSVAMSANGAVAAASASPLAIVIGTGNGHDPTHISGNGSSAPFDRWVQTHDGADTIAIGRR